jgi:MSHA type pilus biogenesis protein MshL
MKFHLLFLALAGALAAAPFPSDHPLEHLRFEHAPLAAALRAVGRSCQVSVIVAPEVTGEVTIELGRMTLGQALAALTEPNGDYFEEADGCIYVRKLKTVLYTIDYPQLTRSGSGNASITLGGANSGTTANGTASSVPVASTTLANGTVVPGSDTTQVSISQDNQNTFWSGLETELHAMLKEGDSLVVNKFSGVAQVTAPVRRQEAIRAFLDLVNHRISQQVEIEARLVEVSLDDEQKLGVDWDLATASLGGLHLSGVQSAVDVTDISGTALAANTFSAGLGIGHATAVINALKQQGTVTTVAQPRLRALNNQTAFIKVGEDRPFFRLQQSTTFSQAGVTTPVNQTQQNFSVSTITIGTILAITPQIDGHGVITLDVLPAITRLESIVTSPDGQQTAPVTEVKQASTIVRLKDGETAVIGGLISDQQGDTTRSVPLLGAVPVLGRAFQSKATLHSRTELVIFLTPHLVNR